MKTKLLEVEVRRNMFTLVTLDGRIIFMDMSRRYLDESKDYHDLLNKKFPDGWEISRHYLNGDEKLLEKVAADVRAKVSESISDNNNHEMKLNKVLDRVGLVCEFDNGLIITLNKVYGGYRGWYGKLAKSGIWELGYVSFSMKSVELVKINILMDGCCTYNLIGRSNDRDSCVSITFKSDDGEMVGRIENWISG